MTEKGAQAPIGTMIISQIASPYRGRGFLVGLLCKEFSAITVYDSDTEPDYKYQPGFEYTVNWNCSWAHCLYPEEWE